MEQKKQNNVFLTGKEWAEFLGLSILPPYSGWFAEEDYLGNKISRHEFLLRASNSQIEYKEKMSRRDAAKLKTGLHKKYE